MNKNEINDQIRERLTRIKSKIRERGEFKPESFLMVDSLLAELDAIENFERWYAIANDLAKDLYKFTNPTESKALELYEKEWRERNEQGRS